MLGRSALPVFTAGALAVALTALAPAALAATVPGKPRSVTVSGGNAKITVSWLPPTSDGGSTVTGYTATCSGTGVSAKSATVGGATLTAMVTGVTNGVSYTCTVVATNAIGTGPASTPSASTTPAGPPGAPTGVSDATSGSKITVKWKAPKSDGGAAITGYSVACTSTDGGAALSASAAASLLKVSITGLPANKTYRCSVSATNSKGTSAATNALGWAMHAVTMASAPTVRMHFPVAAGKQITAVANGTTFGPSGCADYYSSDPQGNVLYDGCLYADEDNVVTLEKPSPTSGTATVTVASPSGNTGSAELNSYVFLDVTGTVHPDASNFTYSLPYPGQSAFLTFSGTAGQLVSLLYSASTILDPGYTSLRDPSNNEIGFTGEYAESFMDATKLPVNGTYTLAIDHGYGAGTATFQLFTVPANTGTITRGGSAVTISLPVPGENATRTFHGTSGQTVTVSYTGSTIDGGYVSLLDSSGSELSYATLYDDPNYTGTTSTVTLPSTGTYTVLVDPGFAHTGTVKVKVTA